MREIYQIIDSEAEIPEVAKFLMDYDLNDPGPLAEIYLNQLNKSLEEKIKSETPLNPNELWLKRAYEAQEKATVLGTYPIGSVIVDKDGNLEIEKLFDS